MTSETVEPPSQVARPSGQPLDAIGVAIGGTVEVLWDVELDDGSADAVWWAAKVEADASEDEAGAARLVYVADHGFEEETRRVLFLEGSFLWDTGLKERLPYRREGEAGPELDEGEEEENANEDDVKEEEEEEEEEHNAAAEHSVGSTVKARFQGGERYCAGTIQAAHADGTYDVLYEDHVLEQNGIKRNPKSAVLTEINSRFVLEWRFASSLSGVGSSCALISSGGLH
uniref:Tudor domain-containing protein n=1 Tax=Haptolina brevifila TaxID=156173 RepID=A0A7S2JJ40_9EUKA|mmetsp:Transcript_82575/g.164701  ORF Transcript_82575/g.164701 Transcript_82575/m.164701 type:complete len:229 (+) Transcript_82575:120-806(+)